MLKVRNLEVEILNKKILDNISFAVNSWDIFAILGHNGSWKTTLLKAIMGLVPAKWEIIFKNTNILDLPVEERAKLGIAYIMQEVPEYTGISVLLYVKNILNLVGKYDEEKIKYYFDLFWLDWEVYKNRNFDSHLSGGEKKKIEIITTFLMDKDLYLLDEIEASLDATSRKVLIGIIKSLSKKWKTFLIVSHNHDIISCAENWILLCSGKLEKIWKVVDLLEKYDSSCISCPKNI